MSKIPFLTTLFIAVSIYANAQSNSDSQSPIVTPESLAEAQLVAYNKRNIEAFLAPYADSVEVYRFPNTLMSKGKEAMRKNYTGFFKNTPNLHCEIQGRMVQGTTVIDQERVTGVGSKPMEAIAIYQVEENKIKKVYFIY